MIKRTLAVLTLALLLGVAAMADARTRIFVDQVEYVGPQITVDGVLYVDAAQFATQTGWSEAHGDGVVAILPEGAKVPDGGSGLYVLGQAFSGKTQVQNGAIYAALPDLVSALGGSIQQLPQYHAVRISGVPGMPNEAVLKSRNSRQMVSVDVKSAGFTLVEYYATW